MNSASESKSEGIALDSIFPLKRVRDIFEKPVATEEFNLASVGALSEKDPQPILQLGLSLWHQIVTRSLFIVDPRAIASFVDDEDPFLYFRIEEMLGEKLVYDMYYASLRVEDTALEWSNLCCQLCIAHTYPNDIILTDAYFANPYNPLPSEIGKDSKEVQYEGLHLLGDFFQELKKTAEAAGCERILFSATDREDLATYQQFGFTVDESPIAKMASAVGMNIPMQLLLS